MSLEEQIATVAKQMKIPGIVKWGEIKALPEYLLQGEVVVGLSNGVVDNKSWALILTNYRLLMLRKKFFLGIDQLAIDLHKITSLSSKNNIIFGEIFIGIERTVLNVKEVPKRNIPLFIATFQNLLNGSLQVEPQVNNYDLQQQQMSQQALMQQQMSQQAMMQQVQMPQQQQMPQHQPQAPQQNIPVENEFIKKLQTMRDKGMISQEEFEIEVAKALETL